MPNTNTNNGATPNAKSYQFASEVREMSASGVHQAQEESRAAGVPNVYSINGILHWELPDGSLTTQDPWGQQANSPTTKQ